MTDYDIHSCGYYCDRHACIEAQRNELRDKLFSEPTIDGWPLWSGLPQPEPVAYINVEERKLEWATPIKWETPTVVNLDKIPLYTKKEWVGLTDEQYEAMAEQHVTNCYFDTLKYAKAIEAKLKEKNND